MIDVARARARAGSWSRRQVRRVEARVVRRRTGYVYVWSRVARDARTRARPPYRGPMMAVTLDELPVRAPGAWYEELEPPAPAAVPPEGWRWPNGVGSGGRALWRRAPQPHGVIEIPNGIVFGRRGSIGPDTRGVLVDACMLWHDDQFEMLPKAEQAVRVGVEDLDGVTMTVWAGPPNHSHCLLQTIPRLALLRRRFGLEADHYLMATPPARATLDALAALGVPDDRIRAVPSPAPAFRCEVLRYGTAPYLTDAGADWAVEFVHELFLPQPPAVTGRRLYVARGAGSRRRMLNEDDVRALLEPAGFETVFMEGRSVAEQAELFAAADVIVAPHGAAMANLVFCRPGTVVVELMGANTIGDFFARLSWRRGLDYELVLGTEPTPPPRWWSWQIDAETVADVDELRRRLGARGLL